MALNGIEVKVDLTRLTALLNGVGPKAEAILDKAAFDVEGRWKEYIVQKGVIHTGAYLGSVHVVEKHKPFERVVADAVTYGIFQEFGTSRKAARPCATPAIEDNRNPFLTAWEALFE